MFNLAKEKLVEEGFNNLGMQVQQLASLEMQDMKNITLNFIDLKNKLEATISENSKLRIEIDNIKKDFESLKYGVLDSLTKKVEVIEVQKVVKEEPKIEIPIKKEVDYSDKNMWGHCMTCEGKQKIKDPEVISSGEGGKMTTGSCMTCGRKIFKINT